MYVTVLCCRSQLYCKYRLCCTLQSKGVVGVVGGGVVSGYPVHMSFPDFLHFENGLASTVASSLVAVWVSCEGHRLGVKQHWAAVHTIRAHAISLPFLSDMVIKGCGIHDHADSKLTAVL